MRCLEEAQLSSMLGAAWTSLGYGYALLGQMDTALNHTKKGLEVDVAVGNPVLRCFHHGLLSVLYLESGNLENARICAEKALQAGGVESWAPLAWTVLGSTLGKIDSSQSAKAEGFILRGIKVMEENKLRPRQVIGNLYLADLYVDTGQRQKALETLEKTQQMMQEMGIMGYWLARTKKALEKLKAQ